MLTLLAVLVVNLNDGPRLLTDEVSAGLGVFGSGYSQPGVRLGDANLSPTVTGRVLFSGVTLEGGVLVVAPLTRDGSALAVTGSARVGWTGQRFTVLAGVLGQWGQGANPAWQWLPTVRASVDFGPFGLTLGVFDLLGLVPAHLSFDVSLKHVRFSVGWVAPIGLVGTLDLPVAERFAVRFQAFAYKLAQAEFAQGTVGVVFAPGGLR
jgi:hypothetical protein